MSEITRAIQARQTQITQLQSEIEILKRAAGLVGTKAPAKSKAKPQPKPKAQKGKRHQWSAAEKAAIGKRMRAYWAKRRKAKG